MKGKLAAAGTVIATALALKKTLQALALITLANQGMAIAAQGGNFNQVLIAMIGVLLSIALPMGLIGALLDD